MKIFTNKKIWQKIVIVLLIMLLFQIFIPKSSHAIVGDVLLEPITGLFANLGDGVMSIMQKTFMGMDASGAWVEESSNLWIIILTICAAVLIAVIAGVAIFFSCGLGLAFFIGTFSAVVKIGLGTAVVCWTVSHVHFGEKGFYLPEFKLTPQAIFQNEILAFDVNFFNPKQDELKTTSKVIQKEIDLSDNFKWTSTWAASGAGYYLLNEDEFSKFKQIYGFSDSAKKDDSSFTQSNGLAEYDYEWKHDDKTYIARISDKNARGERRIYDMFLNEAEIKGLKSPANELQPTIASWYIAFRNIALVALLSVLVYIGIRITLSSISSDKAKYKQMLVDWVTAICLVFLMHYIMSFAVTINEKIVDAIKAVRVNSLGDVDDFINNEVKPTVPEVHTKGAGGVEYTTPNGTFVFEDNIPALFVIEKEDAKRAYKVLVGDDNAENAEGKSGENSDYINRFSEDHETLYWPADDFMTQARLLGQDQGEDDNQANQTAVMRAGYNIIYIVLVIFTVIFCFTYLKRVIYLAFLTIIAPLVAITYPIDKINDGKAQAFDMWLKEYIFNLLIQPLHLVLYTVLVGSAMKFASNNIFYAVVALGFLVPAEKLVRRFFGFEKAQTAGMFAGATGTALMMSGLNRLMHRPPSKRRLNSGESGGSEGKEKEKFPKMNRKFEDDPDLFSSDNSKQESDDYNGPKFPDNRKARRPLIQNDKENNKEKDTTDSNKEKIDINQFSDYYKKSNKTDGSDTDKSSGNGTTKNKGNNNSRWQRFKNKAKNKTRRIRGVSRGVLTTMGKNSKTYRRYKGKTNGQVAALFAKRALSKTAGLGARVAIDTAAITAAGLASFSDPSKAVQNITTAAVAAHSFGKGVSDRFDATDNQNVIEAAKESYYGDDYDEVQQEKYQKQFARDEENIRKIEKKKKVDREQAKEIAEQIAHHTRYDGVDNVEDALAFQEMLDHDYTEDQARFTIGYNKAALNGANTNYMKSDDRAKHQSTYKNSLIKRGVNETEAEERATRLFNAMDAYYNFKK